MVTNNRNKKLHYGADDKPRLIELIFLSFQYMIPIVVSLVFIIIVLKFSKIHHEVAANILSITLIIMAIISLLQAIKLRYLSPGMLLPPSVCPPYIAPCILAIKTGGLSLVFGMTLFAGIIQAGLGFFVRYTRILIPEEVASLVLLLIGFEVALYGADLFLQTHHQFFIPSKPIWPQLLYYLPLVLIIALDQICGKILQRYSLIVTIIISYLVFYFCHLVSKVSLAHISHAHWLFVPDPSFLQVHFDYKLIIPFALAAFICSAILIGIVYSFQEAEVEEHQQADFKQIAKANIVDGLGTLLGGFFGSIGISASSSCAALSLSTRIFSRYIAIPLSLFLLVLAFVPKFELLLLEMPSAIIAAVLINMGCRLVKSSAISLLKSLHLFRTQLAIGIAFAVGISYSIYPEVYDNLPDLVKMFIGSTIAIAIILSAVLNLVFKALLKFQD